MASGTHDTTEQVLNEMRALRDELGALRDEYQRRAESHQAGGDDLRAMVEQHTSGVLSEAHSKAYMAVLRAEQHQHVGQLQAYAAQHGIPCIATEVYG